MRISLIAIVSITTVFVYHGKAGPLREASNANINLAKRISSSFLMVGSVGKKTKETDKTGGPKKLIPGVEFKLFAHFARASYILKRNRWDCIPNCRLPETTGTIIDHFWHHTSPLSVGYIGHNHALRVIVVAFRGTADTDDWVQDSEFSFDRWPSHIPNSMVHHGFLEAYNSVADSVKKTVFNMISSYPDYKLVFTGHSLGGAETVLSAIDILHNHPEIKSRTYIYTYGMPRIGNDAWADAVDKMGLHIYRVVYENDLVPHIPFQWLGYKHFGEEVWIHNNKTIFCGRNGESPNCSAGISIMDYNVPDHGQYVNANWTFAI